MPSQIERPADLGKPAQTSLRRQFWTIARRQLRLILSDRGYFVFLALLPFILGALSLAVPGHIGFGIPDPTGLSPDEPSEIGRVFNIGAVFIGIALTIRDLIGERAILSDASRRSGCRPPRTFSRRWWSSARPR